MRDPGYALAVLVVLNIIDWVTTYYGLRLGLEEANPIARLILSRAGPIGLYTFKLIVIALAVLIVHKLSPKELEQAVWILNALLAIIIAWNSIQLYLALTHN
jgi:hypothetical protein